MLRLKVKSTRRKDWRDALQETKVYLNALESSWEGGVQGGGGWISVPD